MDTAPRFAAQHRVPLAGSERKAFAAEALPAAKTAAEPPTAAGQITVSVILAPKTPFEMPEGSAPERLTREEFAIRHGASPTSVQLVAAFAKEFGLTVEPAVQDGRRHGAN